MLTTEAADEKLEAAALRLIEEKRLDDGRRVRLTHDHRQAEPYAVTTLGHETARQTFADLQAAVAAYNGVGRPEVEKLAPAYRGIGDMRPREAFKQTVFAVGASPEDAVAAFCRMLADAPEDLYVEPDEKPDFQWFATFRMRDAGDSMKAAGTLVPGGAVLTWWK